MPHTAQTPPTISEHHIYNRLRSQLILGEHPIIVGIAGDSGSGKTTYSDGIRQIFGKELTTTIELDGYHTENRKERASTGHSPLDPTYNHLGLAASHLALLRSGMAIDIPTYDHERGDFGPTRHINPTPIIIIEGLHALADEFQALLDFTIFVDPSRTIKQGWKYSRDVQKRHHHDTDSLKKEMVEREALYKRYIDYQKTAASVVVKIHHSKMSGLSRYEYAGPMLDTAYWIELIIVNSSCQLPTVNLPFDLGGLTQRMDEAFILGTIPSHYWGRSVNSVLLDGYIPKQAVETLFRHMERCTGISPEDTLSIEPSSPESVSSVKFAQLLIAWRFLEEAYRLSMNNRLDSDEQRAQ